MSSLKKIEFPAEIQLLTHCLSLGNKGVVSNPDKAVLKAVNWDLFLEIAEHQHRVLGFICQNITQYGCDFFPEQVVVEIKRRNRLVSFRMLKLTAELIRLLEMFKQNGISALPFKGPVLGLQLYGDVTTRHCGDIDLVIPQAHVHEASQLLIKSGYNRIKPSYELTPKHEKIYMGKYHHLSMINPDLAIKVEIHWDFLAFSLSPISFEMAWQNRQTVMLGENKICGVALEDTLILLLLHGGKHGWRRLFWLHDIYAVLKKFGDGEWKRLMDRINRLNIQRPAYYAFALVELFFDLQLPRFIKTLVEKDIRVDLLIQLSLEKVLPPVPLDIFPQDRIRELIGSFFFLPNNHYIIRRLGRYLLKWEFEYLPLPDRLLFLYYPLRFHLLFFEKYLKIKPASRNAMTTQGKDL